MIIDPATPRNLAWIALTNGKAWEFCIAYKNTTIFTWYKSKYDLLYDTEKKRLGFKEKDDT